MKTPVSQLDVQTQKLHPGLKAGGRVSVGRHGEIVGAVPGIHLNTVRAGIVGSAEYHTVSGDIDIQHRGGRHRDSRNRHRTVHVEVKRRWHRFGRIRSGDSPAVAADLLHRQRVAGNRSGSVDQVYTHVGSS